MSRLYIIAAPSGGGKTSLVRALVNAMDDLIISVSHTTRPPRVGEADGVNYFFVNNTQFEQLIRENFFLEYARVFNYWYGTSREWIEQQLNHNNKNIILEIDWQGAKQIRDIFKGTTVNITSIFILPPSMDVLQERLKSRGQDTDAVIQKRMKAAAEECAHANEFDYVVVNDDFNHAVESLKNIITEQYKNP